MLIPVYQRNIPTTLIGEELADELIRISGDLDSILFSLKLIKMSLHRRISDRL